MKTMKAIDLFEDVDGNLHLIQRGITLAAFFEVNEIADVERVDVLEKMVRLGFAYFGGGATPVFMIRWTE